MASVSTYRRALVIPLLLAGLGWPALLRAQITLQEDSFIRQDARAYWWGHTVSNAVTGLPFPGSEDVSASQANGNVPSLVNSGTTTYRANAGGGISISAAHTMLNGGFLTSTAAIRFHTGMEMSYGLAGSYSASGSLAESGLLNVRLKNLDTDAVLFENNQGGLSLDISGGAPSGNLTGILEPGNYEFQVLCRVEGGTPGQSGNATGAGEVVLTFTPDLPILIPITNAGFEDNALNNGTSTGAINGWSIAGGVGGTWDPPVSEFPDEAPQGENVAFSNGATISQIIPEVILADTVYALIVEVGDRLTTYNIPGYTIELRAGGSLLAADTGTLSPPNGRFQTAAINYVALPGDANLLKVLEIRLISSGPQTQFDAVRLVKMPLTEAIENLTSGDKYASVQAAIDEALDGDMIEMPPGFYYEHIDLKGKAITLRSRARDAASAVLAGLFTDASVLKGSVVTCSSSETDATVLEALTIAHGNGFLVTAGDRRGGGGYIVGAGPTFRACLFRDNDTTRGGGLYLDESQTTIEASEFVSNRALRYGGAIYLTNGSNVQISESRFEMNRSDDGGGAVQNVTSSLALQHCEFVENQAVNLGGAVVNDRSQATIEDCEFIGNSVQTLGGAIYNGDSSPQIARSLFLRNQALAGSSEGGAIYNVDIAGGVVGSSPLITDTRFESNSANSGGAIMSRLHSSPTLLECVFLYNRAANSAGALYDISGADSTIAYCRFLGNKAMTGSGGARVSLNATGYVSRSSIHHSVFIGNSAGQAAGAINNNVADSAYYHNCVFAANSAGTLGGVFYVDRSDLVVNNSIFLDNAAPTSKDIHTLTSGTTEATYSLIPGGFPGTGNVDAAPLFVRAPDDGGDGWGDDPATADVDESANDDFGDLQLSAGSPAIDAGNSIFTAAVDLAGHARAVDDPATPNTGFGLVTFLDIGPYEFGAGAAETFPEDINGDGVVNLLDLDLLSQKWLQEQ